MTARPRPGARRRPAGTPTRLNLDVLVATFGLVDRVADGIAVTDLPHLRRCVAAGLVAVDPRGILTLTPAGRSARDAHLAASPHLLRPANDVRPNPGAKRRTPAILRHCVAKVAGERGVSGAYAICTASLQRAGVMRGGKLTAAGRARDARHRRRTAENRAKDTAFEVALAKHPKDLRAEAEALRVARGIRGDATAVITRRTPEYPILTVSYSSNLSEKDRVRLERSVDRLGWRAWAVDLDGIAFKPSRVDIP